MTQTENVAQYRFPNRLCAAALLATVGVFAWLLWRLYISGQEGAGRAFGHGVAAAAAALAVGVWVLVLVRLRQWRAALLESVAERERADEARRESEERLSRIVETAPSGIIVFDKEGRASFANAAAEKLFQLPRASITSRAHNDPAWKVTTAAGAPFPEDKLPFAQVQRTNLPVYVEHGMERPDGSRVVVDVIAAPLRDAVGNFAGMVASLSDITERRQADERLREGERFLSNVFTSIEDGISVLDMDMRILRVNRAMEQWYAHAMPLVGRKCHEAYHGRSARCEVCPTWHTIQTGETAHEIIPKTGPGGKQSGWLDLFSFPLVDKATGKVRGVIEYVCDITERKKAEEALRESEERFRRLWESTFEAIAIHDKGIIIEANTAFAKVFGYERGEVVGMNALDFAAPESRELVRNNILSGYDRPYEAMGLHKDGSTFPGELWGHPFWYGGKEVRVTVLRDITERKKAEEALRDSEKRYRAVVEDQNELICRFRPDGTLTFVNGVYARYFGKRPEELLGHTFMPLVHEDDRARVHLEIASMSRERPTCSVEERVFLPSGEMRWQQWSNRALFDAQGQLIEYQAVGRDITERRQAEEALRESERKYRALVETTATGFLIIDAQGTVVDANAEYVRLTGHKTLAEILGRPVVEWTAPHDRERNAAEVAKCAATGRVRDLVVDYAGPNGVITPIEINATVVQTAGGARLLSLCRDITERKRAEDALRQSAAHLAQAQRLAHFGSFRADSTGKPAVVTWSDEYFRIFGYKPGEVQPSEDAFLARVHPDDRARVEANLRRLLTTGGPGNEGFRIVRPDGTVRHLVCTLAATLDEARRPVELLGVALDVTDREQAEEERRKLEERVQHVQKLESLGVLAGGIAHDFNNILAVILGNANLALLKLPPASPARDSIRDVEAAALRAAELCKQMLAYSGRGRFVVEPLNLSEAVREMAHLLTVSISKSATLKYNFAAELPLIEADATQVQQVVMNLITNASEALGDKEGVIAVSTGALYCSAEYLRNSYLDEQLPAGHYAFLEVSDTGCGMDRETVGKIFEPFFTTKFTGRGLGLSAVLGIVRGHKGAIKVYSEPGRGTTCKVLFPAAKRVTESQRIKLPSMRHWRGTGTILIADDEAAIRNVAKGMLEWAGFTVLTAANGREALSIFQQHTDEIVCVIMDLTMPLLDGEAAFRELRQVRGDVRVIMTSGYNEPEVTQRFAGKGLAGFIQKPFTADALAAKVRDVLARAPGADEA